MAGSLIRVEVKDQGVRDALERLLRDVRHPERALKEIGEVLTESTIQRFATETDPDGQRWAENSDLTLLRHLERGKGVYKKDGRLSAKGAKRIGAKKILTDGGFLGDSIHPQLGADGQSVEVGTDLVYGAAHQFGMPQGYAGRDTRNHPIPWGDIPARPFLGISADDRARILEILEDSLTR
jgi:phage virion morphogenesis protein